MDMTEMGNSEKDWIELEQVSGFGYSSHDVSATLPVRAGGSILSRQLSNIKYELLAMSRCDFPPLQVRPPFSISRDRAIVSQVSCTELLMTVHNADQDTIDQVTAFPQVHTATTCKQLSTWAIIQFGFQRFITERSSRSAPRWTSEVFSNVAMYDSRVLIKGDLKHDTRVKINAENSGWARKHSHRASIMPVPAESFPGAYMRFGKILSPPPWEKACGRNRRACLAISPVMDNPRVEGHETLDYEMIIMDGDRSSSRDNSLGFVDKRDSFKLKGIVKKDSLKSNKETSTTPESSSGLENHHTIRSQRTPSTAPDTSSGGESPNTVGSPRVPRKFIANWRHACDRTRDRTKELLKRWRTLPESEEGSFKDQDYDKDNQSHGGWSVHVWAATWVRRTSSEEEISIIEPNCLSELQKGKLTHFFSRLLDWDQNELICEQDFKALTEYNRSLTVDAPPEAGVILTASAQPLHFLRASHLLQKL
uniref:Uncharacterized protein n=1 Tax=Timema cristinae TaxID=61476 RepID=A0A7R9H776_TIMCR|nr:unnamed protein product [Timema cristinae]